MSNCKRSVLSRNKYCLLIKSKLFLFSLLVLFTNETVRAEESKINQKWHSVSDKAKFTATFRLVNGETRVGHFQEWLLTLVDQQNDSVFPAQIKIDGGMPSHGYDLPTQPRVTEYAGEGKYVIEGLKFNITGEWLMVFDVTSTEDRDKIRFTIHIDR